MELSHLDETGKVNMVDVGTKPVQRRMARAGGCISLSEHTILLIGNNQVAKGDVVTLARIAGIQAAKCVAQLIPLCHPIMLDKVDVDLELTASGISAKSEVSTTGRTGVEMEALTAVSVALLTVYDMCKAVDKSMVIDRILLLSKEKLDVTEI